MKNNLIKCTQLVFFGYLIFSAFVSLTPGDPNYQPWYWDKAAHFIGYAIMALLALISFNHRYKKSTILLSCITYSALIEVVQYFVPYRSMSLNDLFANVLGFIAGLIVFYCMTLFLSRKRN